MPGHAGRARITAHFSSGVRHVVGGPKCPPPTYVKRSRARASRSFMHLCVCLIYNTCHRQTDAEPRIVHNINVRACACCVGVGGGGANVPHQVAAGADRTCGPVHEHTHVTRRTARPAMICIPALEMRMFVYLLPLDSGMRVGPNTQTHPAYNGMHEDGLRPHVVRACTHI